MFPRSIIVLKNKYEDILPDNISYLIANYTGDCPICLQYFCKPVTSYCEHIYCEECIYESLEFSKECPVCRKEISRLFNVDLHIRETNLEYICFKLLSNIDMMIKNVSEYSKYPYEKIYYCQDVHKVSKDEKKSFCSTLFVPKKAETKKYFYQSVDGQPYYLDNNLISSIIRKEGIKNLPKYIFGKVLEIKEVVFKKDKSKSLGHLRDGSIIYITKISIKED